MNLNYVIKTDEFAGTWLEGINFGRYKDIIVDFKIECETNSKIEITTSFQDK
jgi:hypothetical protein